MHACSTIILCRYCYIYVATLVFMKCMCAYKHYTHTHIHTYSQNHRRFEPCKTWLHELFPFASYESYLHSSLSYIDLESKCMHDRIYIHAHTGTRAHCLYDEQGEESNDSHRHFCILFDFIVIFISKRRPTQTTFGPPSQQYQASHDSCRYYRHEKEIQSYQQWWQRQCSRQSRKWQHTPVSQ